MTYDIGKYFFSLAKSTWSYSDGNSRIDMTSSKWCCSGNTKIKETADEECPIRIRHKSRSTIQILSGVDSISQEHSTNCLENKNNHFLRLEHGREISNPSLDFISLALSYSFHCYVYIQGYKFIWINIYNPLFNNEKNILSKCC